MAGTDTSIQQHNYGKHTLCSRFYCHVSGSIVRAASGVIGDQIRQTGHTSNTHENEPYSQRTLPYKLFTEVGINMNKILLCTV